MDEPSVNWKFYKALNNQSHESKLPTLIEIGSCSLHIVKGAFQSGAESTVWRTKQTLKRVYQLFHDSPVRREDYENVTGSTTYPLAFCSTRWVESMKVANRVISIWPNIEEMISFWEKLLQSKRPKCKSYDNVKNAANDNLMAAKLELFSYIAGILQPFFKSYQSDDPMLPFLYFDLKSLVSS